MYNHKPTEYAVAVAAAFAMVMCGSDDMSSNAGTAAPDTGTSTAPVKNVVFFLGDGMGMTTVITVRIYKVGEDGGLTMDTLPEIGFVRTFSNNAQVTDSVSSMSAYMTSARMSNEAISMSPGTIAYDVGGKDYLSGADSICPNGNGRPVTTLLEPMKAVGYGTGAVTTMRITHVTPATTHSHICHRDGENTIVTQLTPAGKGSNAVLGDGVDAVFGGGRKHSQPTMAGDARTDGRDLIAELKASGYHYASNKAGFDTLQAIDGKVVGLFTNSHMSYDLNRDPSKEPSLGEMTNKTIDVLVAEKKGFFLMVEGGRIDHALHETTVRRALQDTVAFDSVTRGAIDKLNMVDPGLKNMLTVVTADHNHTLVLNGCVKRTGPTSDSNPGVLGLLKNYVTGANATDTGGNPFTIIGLGTGENRPATRGTLTDAAVYDKNYHQEAVTPVVPGGETHGGADAFTGAHGLDAERFTGTMDNIEVFGLIKQAMGLQEGEGTS